MERLRNTVLFVVATAAVSSAVNAGVCAGLNRYTNLTPSMQGAISAGVISGVGAAVLVGNKWVADNLHITVDFIHLFVLPFILTWALSPQVSRVFPEAKVTLWQGAGYAVIGNIAYLVLFFKVFSEDTMGNIIGNN